MAGAPTPQFLPSAFAVSAVNPTYINLIPASTVTAGKASFTLGFPPSTMTPKIAGGVPPFGQDMNGILYMLSTWAVYQQAGETPRFSSTVATAIGGYALGTLLRSTDGATLWFNISSGNTTDPDGGSAAGWVATESYGLAAVTGVTGGVTTLTATQAAKSFIVLSGALASNAQVVLPNYVRSWLVVNQCSGGFTVTVKTAAGTGVDVPAGGFSQPVGVYGDGTNIYPVVTPLSIPTDVAPTPNTYPIRSSAGYIYATFFNMSGGADNLAVTNVIYENGGDGFLRKMSQANFRAQLFADAALTGVPTAPTPAPGDSSTKIATTAFVHAFAGNTNYGAYVDAGASLASVFSPSLVGATVSYLGGGRYQIIFPFVLGTKYSIAWTANPMMNGSPDDRYCNIFDTTVSSVTVQVLDQGSGAVANAFMLTGVRIAP